MNKRILVTGASGFIGSHILSALSECAKSCKILASSRTPPSCSPANVEWIPCDLLNPDEISNLISKHRPTHLIHTAWIATHGDYWTSPQNLDWVAASLRLLKDFYLHGGLRAVIVGTSAEYDWSEALSDETSTRITPQGLYGCCKNALREVLEAYANQNKYSYAWARLFCVYGPGEPDSKLIPKFSRRFMTEETVSFSGGFELRDFLHAADVANGLVHLLDSDLQGAVNLGSGVPVSIRNVISMISDQFPAAKLLKTEEAPPSNPAASVVAHTDKITRSGWKPAITLSEGIHATCEAIKNASVNRN